MDKTIITIPGTPIPLKRPRFSKHHTYDSQREIKEAIYWIIKSQTDEILPPTGPINIKMTFFMGIPRSLSKKKKLELQGQPHIKRPDIDNLVKFYLDVCNNAAYKDDAQVYKIIATKIYDENPQTEIEITHGEANGAKNLK